MPTAFDGTVVPEFLDSLPCGGTPHWDYGSAAGYRCETCMAMVGSIGMPVDCHDMIQAERDRNLVIKKLGFKDASAD